MIYTDSEVKLVKWLAESALLNRHLETERIDSINRLLSKIGTTKRRKYSREEVAEMYHITERTLTAEIKDNTPLLNELRSTGWNESKRGFYPVHVHIIQKYLG